VDGRLPLENILKPNAELTKMLAELKVRKWILTNAGLEVDIFISMAVNVLLIRYLFTDIRIPF
jgi:hypothetical protein